LEGVDVDAGDAALRVGQVKRKTFRAGCPDLPDRESATKDLIEYSLFITTL